MIGLYTIEEQIESFYAENQEEFDSYKEGILSEIETLKDEVQERLDNMPEQLQYAPTGELLQERIDALDEWYSELESIECDIDEDSLREEIEDEGNCEDVEEELSNRIQEKVNDAISDFQDVSRNCM